MTGGVLPWVALAGVTVALLWVDLHFFARGREPSFREGVYWSIGWLVVSLLAGATLLFLDAHGVDDAITYTTVYFIERSLSLDNLFVFLLLFAYFGVPAEYRARLLFWGIAAALVLRGLAILGGVALLQELHFFIYVLGVLLLVLAYRILRGVEDNVDPDRNLRRAARAAGLPGHGRVPRQRTGSSSRRDALRDAAVRLPGRRSWRPTSRSRSTRSRPRSRSRATPC